MCAGVEVEDGHYKHNKLASQQSGVITQNPAVPFTSHHCSHIQTFPQPITVIFGSV